jgi:hypothetical protein
MAVMVGDTAGEHHQINGMADIRAGVKAEGRIGETEILCHLRLKALLKPESRLVAVV